MSIITHTQKFGGSSAKGIYITVDCDAEYQGVTITCTYGTTSVSKICGNSNTVDFFFSSDIVSLPQATFNISNSINSIINSVSTSIYGWYSCSLIYVSSFSYYITFNHPATNGTTINATIRNNDTSVVTNHAITASDNGLTVNDSVPIQESRYSIVIRFLSTGGVNGKTINVNAVFNNTIIASVIFTANATNLSYAYTGDTTLKYSA